MSRSRNWKHAAGVAALALTLILMVASNALAQHYTRTDLTTDNSSVTTAPNIDPNLVNPWGLSRSSGSPWWISDNGPGLTTLYGGTGTPAALVVTIPPADSSTGAGGTPTGQIFNGTSDFQLAPGFPARFIFVTEDGTISGWNPAVNASSAVIKVNTNSASVFKGVAVASVTDPVMGALNFLYVADFRKGHVNVYDTSFHRIRLGEDAFQDERKS